MDPVAQRPGFFRRVYNTGVTAVNTGVAVLAPNPIVVVQGAARVADKVLNRATGMAAPALAHPVVRKATLDLASMLAAPALQVIGWKRGFDTIGANLIQAWGVHSQKHDWDQLSAGTTLPNPTFPTDIETPQALREKVSPAKREAVTKVLDAYPGPAGPEKLGQLKVLVDRLSPEQLGRLATRLQAFKEGPGASNPFKEEVAGQLIHDLANPLRADNACGPTCSSTSSQLRMARDKPAEYAELVLDLAQGKDHKLPGGATVKAAYGEDTLKKLREGGNGAPASALLFQTNLQHFAASHVSMGKPIQNVFNPLFNGGLNKLFQAFDSSDPAQGKLSQDIDNSFVNKDLDKFNPLDKNRQTGHDPAQMEFLNQQLFPGAKAKSWLTDSPNAIWGAVESDLKKGKSVSVSLFNPSPQNPADRFHVVTVLSVDHKTSPPTVHFHTWGGERTLSLDDFKKSCTMAMPGGR